MTAGRSPQLDELFRPASVAVVGASNRPGKVGTSLFRNLLSAGYQGTAYPVNPSWKSVSGVRCFPDLRSLPEAVDLGVVIVPAPAVARTIDELGRAGARGAIVISAGFREVGEAGAALEAEVVARAAEHHMSLVGPNCFGVINTDPAVGLNATFSESLPPEGNIAFVSQSGALGAGILKYGVSEHIGFSRFVSVGNRAGVDENDLLTALAQDPRTHVILLYVESLANGRKFLETAREVTEHKPVLVIKSGRTSAGERAAKSHTGSLAQSGRDQLYDAVFAQSGVYRVDSLGGLFRLAKIFASGLELEGPRLAILTNSGGPGIVAADAAIRQGLELPALPEPVRQRLAAELPSIAAVANPLDMTADVGAEEYRRTLEALLGSTGIDGALVISTPTGTMTGETVAHAILEAKAASPKPIVACLFGLNDLSEEATFLERHGVPTYTFPEEAVEGLGALARFRAWKSRPHTPVRTFDVDRSRAEAVIRQAGAAGLSILPEYAARGLLEAYGIRFPACALTTGADEAANAAAAIGFPVVLKVASPAISHKTEVGGVVVGLGDADAVRTAWTKMDRAVRAAAPGAPIDGYEVEAQVRGGKEVLVGVQRDPSFGPIVVFGMGGIYVEALRDVTFRLAPMRPLSAQRMIESVRGYRLLQGVRGEPPSDIAALAEVIERVSQLAVERPEIVELDLNPLIVGAAGRGVVAVDARVVLAPSSKSGPTP
ncbi:MAG TPA: acetate--CoA ligase family protein [Thermoplasmata archaeon]|nr:acetate--CoA ligase family protein [Thermoplasmata archaeon]